MPLIIRRAKKNSDKNARPRRVDLKRAGLAFITIAILSVLLSIHMLPSRIDLKVGDVSADEIIAPKAAKYVDSTETRLRKTKAAASVGKAYDILPGAEDQAVATLQTIFSTIEFVRQNHTSQSAEAQLAIVRDRMGAALGARIPDSTLLSLLAIDAASLRQIEDESLKIVSAAMTKEIKDHPSDVRSAQNSASAAARMLISDPQKASLTSQLVSDSIKPNRIYNPMRTIDLQEAAQARVRPHYRLIARGEVILARGEPVLEEHLEKLQALGLRNPQIDYGTVSSLTALVMLAVLLVGAYLARYYPEVYHNTKALLLLALLAVIGTLALRISGSMLGINLTLDQVGYLGVLWVVTVGMLVSALVNPQVSVVIAALLSIVLSLMLNGELRFAVSGFMTAIVGILGVADIRDRTHLARAVGMLAGAGVVLVWVTGGLANDSYYNIRMGTVWAGLIVPIGAGAVFLIGTVPLERLFGLTTHLSLLELADTNKPLLRRLVMEAPGTYTHSIAVGHLAEAAAEAIGADSLMARVASYYHDIGKIRRPHFFVENQNLENVHDRINPTLSALVITSHIKDGVDIAREYKLPRVVIEVISQHHGTSLVQYFYEQAIGVQDSASGLESQFRYNGPKPKSKEAALIMLADSAEAASRAMSKPTRATIELIVNKVVAEKLRDGQLDESDLTFKEVSKIAEAFTKALTGTLHARIDYAEVLDRKTSNGDSDSKPAAGKGENHQAEEQRSQSAAS
ncbi:MAG: HDIG domain-containing protein [Armatimonadetes bacterium]|nr:HDIG domain-containing protein [Armatimonadota bacterium]